MKKNELIDHLQAIGHCSAQKNNKLLSNDIKIYSDCLYHPNLARHLMESDICQTPEELPLIISTYKTSDGIIQAFIQKQYNQSKHC